METSVTLNNGRSMPTIGLGTWKTKPKEVGEAVKCAINAGYRHIDTAFYYENEKEIGDALKEVMNQGIVKREELFITTKLPPFGMTSDDVRNVFDASLKNLQLDYVDLYLIHMTIGVKGNQNAMVSAMATGEYTIDGVDYVDTWKIMETFVDEGRAKSIGVSSFNQKQLERIMEVAKHKPVTNQIELHPYFTRNELANWCQSRGIVITAFSSLGAVDRPWAKEGDPYLLKDSTVIAIAKKHNKSPAQVLLRFGIDRGCLVIPKSVTPKRIHENIEVFDFKLTPDDMESIMALNRNWTVFHILWSTFKDHPHSPYNDELQL